MSFSRVDAAAYAARLRPDESEVLYRGVSAALAGLPELLEVGDIWSAPQSTGAAVAGLVAGFVEGFLEGAEIWAVDLKALFHLVGVGTTVSLTEFFARPMFESAPTGLLPQSRQAASDLQLIKTLWPVVRWLDSVGPAAAFESLRKLIPDGSDLAMMLANATGSWLSELAGKARDPYAVGEHIGRLLGRVVLEIIRAELEPTAWMAAEVLSTPVPPTAAPDAGSGP